MRALTHRAVDAAAALPQGSTSYYAKTRAALIELVINRLAQRSLADLEALAVELASIEPAADADARILQAARALAGSVARLATRRDDMRARWALVLEFSDHDPFAGALTSHSEVVARGSAGLVAFLDRMGVRLSPAELAALPALSDGLIFALTSRPEPHTPTLDVAGIFESYLRGATST